MFRGIGTGHRSIHPKMGDTLLDMIEGCVSDGGITYFPKVQRVALSYGILKCMQMSINLAAVLRNILQYPLTS